jgi:carboxyl-terminal processing protease
MDWTMRFRASRRSCWTAAFFLFLAGWFSSFPLTASAQPSFSRSVDPLDELFVKGQSLESQHRWSEALSHYEEAVRDHPEDHRLRERLDTARIHYSLDRRYADPSFRDALSTLGARDTLELYGEVLLKIDTYFVSAPPWKQLVARGTASLDAALGRDMFLHYHLPYTSRDKMEQFRREMYRLVQSREVRTRHDARRVVEEVAGLAQIRLGLSPAAVAFEYICGAAGGLDDYSTYLTGSQLRDIYSQIEGNFVGLGVELKAEDHALLIVHVIPGSPAEEFGIRPGDRITAVQGRSTSELSSDEAAGMLQGEEGTVADLVLEPADAGPARRLRIPRRHVEVPSVEDIRIIDPTHGVAYARITSFQKTTSRDLDLALWDLHAQGMRALVLDLRGNPGGLLTSAVDVADKFVQQGSIVSTRGRNPQEAFHYDAHRAGTWRVPLVVMIDGESASASEIFAAAIRHNRRGMLVGSRSYGKGSVQGIFPLGTAGSGIRLTTAKFYAPSGRPISQVGVDVDIAVHEAARLTGDAAVSHRTVSDEDRALQVAVAAAAGRPVQPQ